MELLLAVLSGFALALVAPGLCRVARGSSGWLLALLPLGLAGWFLLQAESLAAGRPPTASFEWVPSLGIYLSFHLDGLSLLFALLITGVGALVLIYAGGYLAGHAQLGRLYAYLLMFMASMLGLVLADNVLTLFVFWELTSLSSYLLIGFDHERERARAAALQALLVTGGGGLALLAGLLLLARVGGSFELSALVRQGEAVRSHALYASILLLVLVGAFTKSAQFPFHFWLPSAMEAPTPVSAYLHSATMVKAGVYLLARLNPVLGGAELWTWGLTSVGAATLLVGGSLALVETDLKRILAYSTVGALGMLVFLLGLGTSTAAAAAVVFLLAHALYKGALFLTAGAIDHETGTRDTDRLGGLAKDMPITAGCGVLAAASMAGIAPALGFVAKEAVLAAAMHGPAAPLLTAVTVLGGMFFVAAAGLAGVRPYFGRRPDLPQTPHEAPASLWLGPAALAGLGLGLGFWPALVDEALLRPAVSAIRGAEQLFPERLALWHGWSFALLLGVATLAGGVGVYVLREPIRGVAVRWAKAAAWGPARWYESGLAGLNALAGVQTRLLQSGRLRYYLLTILLTTAGLAGLTLAFRGRLTAPTDWSDIHFYEAGLVGLILLATAAAVHSSSRLAAIAALGVVGYGVALLFVLFGAPDLAMTQFLVETLTVILFVLVFYHLPRGVALSSWRARLRDAGVAAAVGVLVTLLALLANNVESYPTIAGYFGEESVRQGHGRNVVNVILVDFRGLDTLGEITVLAVAAVGVYALLKLRPPVLFPSSVDTASAHSKRETK